MKFSVCFEENFALKQNDGFIVYRETVHGGYEIQTESSRPDSNLDYYYYYLQSSVVVMWDTSWDLVFGSDEKEGVTIIFSLFHNDFMKIS